MPNAENPAKFSLSITQKNFTAADRFLALFRQEIITIQVKPDYENRTSPGKLLWTGKKGGSVYASETPLSDNETLMSDLAALQQDGLAVYFMPNEGDGYIYPPNKTPRSQKNIINLCACFVDTDKGDLSTLTEYCEKHNCPYNLLVETSPGRYHAYFLLEKQSASPTAVGKWDAIQRTFMELDPLYDRSVADTSQLLRIPFFYHQKAVADGGKPFLIKVTQNKHAPIYTLEELFDLSDAYNHFRTHTGSKKFTYPTEKIESGNRHYSMVSYLRHLSAIAPALSKDDLENVAVGFARRHFSEPKDFMPGNSRYRELTHNVESIIQYAEQEEREAELASMSEIKEGEAVATTGGFFHPQEFFDQCPNKMISAMCKHVTSTALYPCPAYDFAAVMAMVGTLKSHLFVSNLGHPPVNYFLCFGPSGVGKNHAQGVISRTMARLGEGGLVSGSLKTEKGLYRALCENRSRFLVMMDEVEGLLSMLTTHDTRRVESYTRGVKDALLKLYSHHNRHFRSAMTGNERERPYEIPNPHLNLIGYGTPTALTYGFNVKSVSDGLLPRFVVLSVPNFRKSQPDNYDPDAGLEREHLEYLKQVVMQGKGKKEADYIELEDLQGELSELVASKGPKSDKKKERIEEIEQRIEEINSGGLDIGNPNQIKFTPKAKDNYLKFAAKMDGLYNRNAESPVAALYTRVAEKAGRLATVLAEDQIDGQLLDWCIEFCSTQLDAELEACGQDGSNFVGEVSAEEVQYRALLKTVVKLSRGSEGAAKRDVSRAMRIGITKLEALIRLGELREEMREVTSRRQVRIIPLVELS